MTRHLLFLFFLLCCFSENISAHGNESAYRSIEFIENRGQWNGPFAYKAAVGGTEIFFSERGFTYVVEASDNAQKKEQIRHGRIPGPGILKYHAYRVHFAGAQAAKISGSKEEPHYYNYFLGNDESRWKTGIHPVLNLDYKNLYAGIDLHVASEGNWLKYDFIVQPGADATRIRLQFEGAESIDVRAGKLLISTSVGVVEEQEPYAFQYIGNTKKTVPCRYKINGNEVTYLFPRGYDPSYTLVIDPTVVFSTFTGSPADNWGFSATYDNDGNFYAGGFVNGDTASYPTTPGAFQRVYGGGGSGGGGYRCDISVTKFNASGTAMLFSTYIGGSDNDQPHSMVVDKNNNLVIAGRTYSRNYPVHGLGYDTSHNGNGDIVVTKLNNTGTALIGSTYIGGSADDGVNMSAVYQNHPVSIKHSYADDARSEVILDSAGNVYVAACTQSLDFPTLLARQGSLAGQQDGVVFKLDPMLRNLLWSTYVGGSDNDACYVLALDTSEANLYVAGGTASTNFPAVSGGLMPTFQGGSADGFILKFQNSGTYPIIRSTFIGRNNYDQCFGIQVDMEDNVYATGNTLGGTFPVSSGIYSNPGASQFIIKLNPDLNTNIYSTVFGSGMSNAINITPVAFLVDTCQNVYVAGWGGDLASAQSTTLNMPVTSNPNPAFQATTDGNDFYFFVLSKNGLSQLYGSFFGSNRGGNGLGEHVDGGTSRFDRNGTMYLSLCGGCGGSSALYTSPGAYSNRNANGNCNLLALKMAFNLGVVKAEANATPKAKGCLPFTVQFQNTSANATSFSWNFDDGSPESTAQAPSHTFTSAGTHRVRMVAFNPNACKIRDTVYLDVFVDTNSMQAGFSHVVTDTCDPFRASFTNSSRFSYTPGAPAFTQFEWFFGDGSSYTGQTPPAHSFPGPGTYTVTLVMHDSTACNDPDTVQRQVEIRYPLVKAGWEVPDSVCFGEPVILTDASVNAASVRWDFGDGAASTDTNPAYSYGQPGTYRIKLTVFNPATCNKEDSLTKTIKIKPRPDAQFDYSPQTPKTNMPVTFINQSTNAVSYLWNFGDGEQSNEINPVHLYRRTDGRFRVCLTAYTVEGCADSTCRDVLTDIRPLVDVPSAFSPNGDGSNDILFVRGGAIDQIHLRIFNRWGELVFETRDMQVGWDGTYNGKEQEMEVYAYTLSAVFTDGTTASKQGNITLLR